jgi:hypothetical protein
MDYSNIRDQPFPGRILGRPGLQLVRRRVTRRLFACVPRLLQWLPAIFARFFHVRFQPPTGEGEHSLLALAAPQRRASLQSQFGFQNCE